MKSVCVIMRTNVMDSHVKTCIEKLSRELPYKIIVAADECKWSIQVDENIAKISLTEEIINKQGLLYKEDCCWRCGDYAIYLVASLHIFDYYWIIEPDVFINFDNIIDFFSIFAGIEIDFLAPFFGKANPNWQWFDIVEKFKLGEPYTCLFPIVRLSRCAVLSLFSARKAVSNKAAMFDLEIPNDESFVATTVANSSDFSSADLNAFGHEVYIPYSTFNTIRPFSHKALLANASDKRVYHPVRSGTSFRRKLEHFINDGQSVCKWPTDINAIFNDIRAELTPQEADMYVEEIASLKNKSATSLEVAKPRHSPLGHVCFSTYHKIAFFIGNPDDYIQNYHFKGIFYREYELAIIEKFFKKGGVLLDVGAHTGNASLYLGVFGRAAKIIPIEPNVKARQILEVNMILNGLHDIVDMSYGGCALGESRGVGFVCYSEQNWGAGCVKELADKEENPVCIEIGDEILSGQTIDFIKITIQEKSASVLRGMTHTIGKNACPVFISMISSEENDIQNFMMKNDYVLKKQFPNYGVGSRALFVKR